MPIAKLKNISLYYETHGKGEPLLLISGLNSDIASWSGVYLKLAKHFRVIGFDNRSSGRSDTPDEPYSIRDMAGDAIALLDHLNIKKCHVMGHSMGGFIAQELAINYPARVEKLVLEATAPVPSMRAIMLITELLERFEKDRDNEALMRSWSFWQFSPKTFEHKNYIANFIKQASNYPYLQSAKGFRSQVEAIKPFNATARLKKIIAKTLVIIGSDDILVYPAESMKLARGIKGSVSLEIKDTGHCVHVENPDVFTSKVMRFLAKNSGDAVHNSIIKQ